MFAGKKSAQIREILISESAWEEMTCLFAPSLAYEYAVSKKYGYLRWAGNNDIAMSEGIILTPAYFNIFNENTPSFLHSEQIAKEGANKFLI
ncbi:hypothetical protein [Klebsiella pneumoniae]